MRKRLLKRMAAFVTALAVSIPMVAGTALFDGGVYADETADFEINSDVFEQLDGMAVSEAEADEDLAVLIDDPMFDRYFVVDDSGTISRREANEDEVDEFIAEMDENAEGISSGDIAEASDQMSCMGCGVSGVASAQIPSRYAGYKKYNCVDVSEWQGDISSSDWEKVKNSGISRVMLRVGYSKGADGSHHIDSEFEQNVKNAYYAGLRVGVYYFSTAVNPSEAEEEAKYTVELLKKYRKYISLPVAYDYETWKRLSSEVMKKYGTESCRTYCEYIKAAGYTPMIYANYTVLTKYIDHKALQKKYKIWLAHYTSGGKATDYPGSYCMWQYTSSGSVNGLDGRIDVNYMFQNGQGWDPKVYKASTTAVMKYRTGPGTKYKSIGKYPKGTRIYIKSQSGNWAKLSTGYYMNRYRIKYSACATADINYRTGPGTGYTKKGTYKKGTKFTIVWVHNGWAKLDNGYFVSAKYTKKQ